MKNKWWIQTSLVGALALAVAACSSGGETVYLDADGDGFGDPAVETKIDEDLIASSDFFVVDNTDCNDSASTANPSAAEICDGLDNDCDGETDEGTNCSFVAAIPSSFDLVSAGARHTYDAAQHSAHTCAISDGTLWCTGANGTGQLGTGDYTAQSEFTQVGGHNDWQTVSAGGANTCGIRGADGEGTLWCWGSNRSYGKFGFNPTGLLGLGSAFDGIDAVPSPTQVGTATNWTMVDIGITHACALNSSHEIFCWGGNEEGPLGTGGDEDSNEPVQEESAFTDWTFVDVGERAESCGIRDDGAGSRTLWCWGNGLSSVSGAGNDTPSQIGTDTVWKSVSVGPWYACGIQESSGDNTLWCGGNNRHGNIGDGTTTGTDFVQIGTDTTWESVDPGMGFTCGVNAGVLQCWGRNYDFFELGLGDDLSSFTSCALNGDNEFECLSPEIVNSTQTWASVSSGNRQSCALTTAGAMFCWGMNTNGEAGAGVAENYLLTPQQVN